MKKLFSKILIVMDVVLKVLKELDIDVLFAKILTIVKNALMKIAKNTIILSLKFITKK